ncbi:hypothetical protein [Hymenobacter psychrophilus]|uniref:hypothetical protein n=1 Tax=Hymenobacter psychrophilus TaxID=651662 RepID=UPI000B853F9A|nr:hypothetical protein [Hymenobacter psychrophilus]
MEELHPTQVWLPFYICDSVLHALAAAGVAYQFYALTEELELAQLPELAPDECLLYVNYFGLKGSYAETLVHRYGAQLLLDLTQAFFEQPASGVWGFNSARKFFGVPDGAFLYAPAQRPPLVVPPNRAISLTHLVERKMGRQTAAYQAYSQYEEDLSYAPSGISDVSHSMLSWLNYEKIARQRQANFRQYQLLLAPLLHSGVAYEWLPLQDGSVPFCYPLRLAQPMPNRQPLFEQCIFVPWLWPEMRQRPGNFALEKSFVDGALALPLDHRYGPTDIRRVAKALVAMLA